MPLAPRWQNRSKARFHCPGSSPLPGIGSRSGERDPWMCIPALSPRWQTCVIAQCRLCITNGEFEDGRHVEGCIGALSPTPGWHGGRHVAGGGGAAVALETCNGHPARCARWCHRPGGARGGSGRAGSARSIASTGIETGRGRRGRSVPPGNAVRSRRPAQRCSGRGARRRQAPEAVCGAVMRRGRAGSRTNAQDVDVRRSSRARLRWPATQSRLVSP